jgi:uroporphyrinogen decarboxylase
MVAPDINTPCLRKMLDATAAIKAQMTEEAPIIGVVMSPFSLPVMQMGFPAYLNLIYEQRDLFWKLMEINEAFCVAWGNAQIAVGATAIAYFDPVSSSTIISRQDYLHTGHKIAQRTLAQINAPSAIHFASGNCLPIINDVITTGAAVVSATALEPIREMKAACEGKLTVLGNLNGIEMARWTPEQARKKVKEVIAAAGAGGGFILSDNHGEIPWQVSDEVLLAIADTVHHCGTYPLSL